MQNIIKQEVHDFIMKSYKESVRDVTDMNDQKVCRNVSIIEKRFFEGTTAGKLRLKFKINLSEVHSIIDEYLKYLSTVVRSGGYISTEIDFIYTLLRARNIKSNAYTECIRTITLHKNGSNQNELVFNISDPIEKLYEVNLISCRTLNSLRVEFGWSSDNRRQKVTIADIVYIPKMRLYSIPNMGDKSIAEIVEFMNNYTIQGRIVPTKDDIRRVLENANLGIDITSDGIIDTYYLTDMFVDAMCTHLRTDLNRIQTLIGWLLSRVCEVAYKDNWGLLDLITVSSMLDLWAYRRGTYCPRDCYYINDITNRIRELLSSKE